MRIERHSGLFGAESASGLAVVIDVFRASTQIVTLLRYGARAVVPTNTLSDARELARQHPQWILAGEREGKAPSGFMLGNSPAQSASFDVRGKIFILSTSAGTPGLVAASARCDTVLVGALANITSVVKAIDDLAPQVVTLVAMGKAGIRPTPEDEVTADYFEDLLRGRQPDWSRIDTEIRSHPEALKFGDPAQPNYPAEDLEFCLGVDTSNVVPELRGGKISVFSSS